MEAEDAAAKTLAEMLPSWKEVQQPLPYARRAVLHNFIKERTRGPGRVSRRLVERGWVRREDGLDDRELTVWEDEEWVSDQLRSLPSAQREVMECIVAGLTSTEIAEVLGKTKEAVRRNLCDARKRLAPKLRQERARHQVPSSPREEAL
jgi:DNA-directed RNA polymerase specialized sigma24 family protein